MGIVMDINKKLYYDNLRLCKCTNCESEFIIGEKNIYDENNLSCPRCHTYSVKIIAKSNDRNLAELELGAFTLTYVEDENKNELINKMVEQGRKYNINFSIEELLKSSYLELLELFNEVIK